MMHDFLLIHRRDLVKKRAQLSPDQLQHSIRDWQEWYSEIAIQNRLITPLQCWDIDGIVVRRNEVTPGPYAEICESVGGITFIQAVNYEEALAIAGRCPILKFGGSIEVRMQTPDAGRRPPYIVGDLPDPQTDYKGGQDGIGKKI